MVLAFGRALNSYLLADWINQAARMRAHTARDFTGAAEEGVIPCVTLWSSVAIGSSQLPGLQ